MINVYIISGFLGAGKTTFIQKFLKRKAFEKVMLLENEFGEVGVDGAFFDKSLQIKEINNGCICCSLQGDFENALEEIEEMGVSDLIIEPSGVGKLSEIIHTIKNDSDFRLLCHVCVVDVKTCHKYHINFKEYFDDQVKSASAIILSHTDVTAEDKIAQAKELVYEINPEAKIVDMPIDSLTIERLLDLIVTNDDNNLFEEASNEHEHHHHEHHHHHHDEDDDDEPFKNLILYTDYLFNKEEFEEKLKNIPEDIIRVKGYVISQDDTLYFNYVLDEYNIFSGDKKDKGLISIIGTSIDEEFFKELFHA